MPETMGARARASRIVRCRHDVSAVCGKAIKGGCRRITNDLAVGMVFEDYYHHVIVLRDLRAKRGGAGSEGNCSEGEIRANGHRRKKVERTVNSGRQHASLVN